MNENNQTSADEEKLPEQSLWETISEDELKSLSEDFFSTYRSVYEALAQ